jgi:hypothetical protein
MPKTLAKRLIPRKSAALTLGIAVAGAAAVALPATASASSSQISIIQDAGAVGPNSQQTFQAFRQLGATTTRIFVPWSGFAPNASSTKQPAGNPSNPGYYNASAWALYDDAVRNAKRYGVTVDFVVAGGAPRWAERRVPTVAGGWNSLYAYYPDAKKYGQFFTAVAKRYSGNFSPGPGQPKLPRVHFWTIYNEPNFGQDLGPQATGGSKTVVAPRLYRGVLNAGWKALHGTGHGRDTILVGGYAARGFFGGKFPGDFAQTPPLLFIRFLYCLDKNNNKLHGSKARSVGCPTTSRAYSKFRSQNPALFNASGVADHPYPDVGSPRNDGKGLPLSKYYATFPLLGNFAKEMDKVVGIYGSRRKFAIYNDEYGYITRPPAHLSPTGHLYPKQDTAANYINLAEYLSYKNPRLKSYMQYLLVDPSSTSGVYAGFASGLIDPGGLRKATYFAYNLPVWMPKTSFSHRSNVEVWGDVRPANFAKRQSVQVQFQAGSQGLFTTLKTVKVTNSHGYFDTHMKFPSSGTVRLAYTYTHDPLLPGNIQGGLITSRTFKIKVH